MKIIGLISWLVVGNIFGLLSMPFCKMVGINILWSVLFGVLGCIGVVGIIEDNKREENK